MGHLEDYAEPASQPQPALDAIMARLSSHRSALESAQQHIGGVLGRAFGELQAGHTAKPGPRAVRAGTIGAIEDHLDDINELMGSLKSMLMRLEAIA